MASPVWGSMVRSYLLRQITTKIIADKTGYVSQMLQILLGCIFSVFQRDIRPSWQRRPMYMFFNVMG